MNKRIRKFANELVPGNVFHPGEHLKDELTARGMSQQELVDALQISKSELSLIINGHRNITPMIAVKLETTLGINAELWMKLQSKYDIDLVKKKYQNQFQKSLQSVVKKTIATK